MIGLVYRRAHRRQRKYTVIKSDTRATVPVTLVIVSLSVNISNRFSMSAADDSASIAEAILKAVFIISRDVSVC